MTCREPLGISPAETKQLRWMLEGAIMNAGFRERLRRAWGLCPRHSWAFALAEIELRGGVPFATSVLVEDLLVNGGDRDVIHRAMPRRRRLAAAGPCPTCEYADGDPTVEPSWARDAEQASCGERMRALLVPHRDELRRCACPACADGAGLPCRPHIVAGARAPRHLDTELRGLAARVRAYRRATEPDGDHDVDTRTAIAWTEGLGWLAGWSPVTLWAGFGAPR